MRFDGQDLSVHIAIPVFVTHHFESPGHRKNSYPLRWEVEARK